MGGHRGTYYTYAVNASLKLESLPQLTRNKMQTLICMSITFLWGTKLTHWLPLSRPRLSHSHMFVVRRSEILKITQLKVITCQRWLCDEHTDHMAVSERAGIILARIQTRHSWSFSEKVTLAGIEMLEWLGNDILGRCGITKLCSIIILCRVTLES